MVEEDLSIEEVEEAEVSVEETRMQPRKPPPKKSNFICMVMERKDSHAHTIKQWKRLHYESNRHSNMVP